MQLRCICKNGESGIFIIFFITCTCSSSVIKDSTFHFCWNLFPDNKILSSSRTELNNLPDSFTSSCSYIKTSAVFARHNTPVKRYKASRPVAKTPTIRHHMKVIVSARCVQQKAATRYLRFFATEMGHLFAVVWVICLRSSPRCEFIGLSLEV